MKQIILLLTFFTFYNIATAQDIDAIKKEAQKAKEQRKKNEVKPKTNSQQEENSRQNYSDDNNDGSGGLLFNILFAIPTYFYNSNHNFNKSQFEKEIFRNKCFEFDLRGGIEPKYPNLYSGKIGYHTGLFSFDYRLNYFIEKNYSGKKDFMNTVDFRFLQLNLFNKKHFQLRLGTGLYIDPINEYWTEYSGGFDIYFKKNFQFGMEYIYAGENDLVAREEVNFKLAYALVNKPKTRLDIVAFGMNQTYYRTVRLNTFGIGIIIRPQFSTY
jgi:hypothetical protein